MSNNIDPKTGLPTNVPPNFGYMQQSNPYSVIDGPFSNQNYQMNQNFQPNYQNQPQYNYPPQNYPPNYQ